MKKKMVLVIDGRAKEADGVIFQLMQNYGRAVYTTVNQNNGHKTLTWQNVSKETAALVMEWTWLKEQVISLTFD